MKVEINNLTNLQYHYRCINSNNKNKNNNKINKNMIYKNKIENRY